MSGRRLALSISVIVCALTGALVFCGVGAAMIATQFGSFGEEAGQMHQPKGVAIDAAGDVYVGDTENDRVDEFDKTGAFVRAWGSGVVDGSTELQVCTTSCKAGNGAGLGFELPTGVAVDKEGDVYVVDAFHFRVEKFKPNGDFILMMGGHVNKTGADVCVLGEECEQFGTIGSGDGEFPFWFTFGNFIAVGGSEDNVYVGDTGRVQVFEPSGKWKENISLAGLSSGGQVTALSVDASDNIFVAETGVEGVHEFEPDGTLKSTQFDEGSTSVASLAVDPSGKLYVGDSTGVFHVLEYGPTGKELDSFGSNTVEGENGGLAFSETTGGLYASEWHHFRDKSFKLVRKASIWLLTPPLPGPLIDGESAKPEVHRAATLEATINPESQENQASYHFEYAGKAQYEAGGFAGAASTDIVTLAQANFNDQPASASLTGLTAGETYYWRVVASDECEAGKTCTATGETQSFEETPAAVIEGPWATHVTGESATLGAKVFDPQQLSTEYRLEYGTSTAYGQVLVGGVLSVAEDSLLIGGHVQELAPATTYHYRVVASNAAGTVQGADHTFTTSSVSSGSTLPDGRRWELVSPPDKHGALIENAEAAYDIQAATDGSGIAYVANEPLTEHTVGRPWSFQGILSQRHNDGWSTEEIAVTQGLEPEMEAGSLGKGGSLPPALFSADLSEAILTPGLHVPALSSEATERTLYVRNNSVCSQEAEHCYTPLVTPSNTPPGTKFGVSSPVGQMQFLAASHDLSHVLFQFPLKLTPDAWPHPVCELCEELMNLYEWSPDGLHLVNILPASPGHEHETTPETDQVYLGRSSHTVAHAVSGDGRRIVWSYERKFREPIYEIRDMFAEDTVQLGGPGAVFQTMSSDGSRIFYLEGGDLHMLDFATKTQTDVTAVHGAGESNAGVQDEVLGASDDGKSVSFVATGVLTGGAVAGKDNLYVANEENGVWRIAWVGTLSNEDEKSWSAFEPRAHEQVLSHISARMSPNGRYVAFMSNRSLTGYDNIDASSLPGEPRRDEEVYVYDSVARHLACASCDPTGARPVGLSEYDSLPLVDRKGTWADHWIGGSIPAWDEVEGGLSVYQPRFLSDSGRLFFDSPDSLVSQDTNGLEDAYQYEPAGVGGCTSLSVTYNSRSGACVDLVSSGTSSTESAFYDASENGDNAFFVTSSRLTGADSDNGYDVYDAHVCSAAAPCLTVPVNRPACTTSDSCRATPSPQPEIFGPAPSAIFSGTGNLVPPRLKVGVQLKSLTRGQRLEHASRVCRKKRDRHKRGACEQQARKQYTRTSSRKGNVTSGGGR
jgi:sugar lactone lactonase YvrE